MRTSGGLWRPSAAHRRVIRQAMAAFGCTEDDFAGGKSRLAVGRARQAAIWALSARWPQLTTSQLAMAVGLGDHSTAVYARQVATKRRAEDQCFHAVTEALARDLPLPVPEIAPEELVAARLKAWATDDDDGADEQQRRDELDGETQFGGIAIGSTRLLQAIRREHPERMAA